MQGPSRLNVGMQLSDIRIGQEYGYRDAPRQRGPLQQVKVIERVRSKWKVEWIEPNPGLQDYVKSVNLVVRWKERRAFLRDEDSWERLEDVCDREWPGHEHPLSEAVDLVLGSTGENIWVGNRGELSAAPDVLERVTQRAGIKLEVQVPAFIDRTGEAHFPFEKAVTFAQAFAATEPETVLLGVEAAQRRWELEAREPGNYGLVSLVQRWKAGWALCRQWAGFDQALAERDAEIERLRRIIYDLGYELRRAGQDELAAKLERKVKGR